VNKPVKFLQKNDGKIHAELIRLRNPFCKKQRSAFKVALRFFSSLKAKKSRFRQFLPVILERLLGIVIGI
jgi:hypothetical protein